MMDLTEYDSYDCAEAEFEHQQDEKNWGRVMSLGVSSNLIQSNRIEHSEFGCDKCPNNSDCSNMDK